MVDRDEVVVGIGTGTEAAVAVETGTEEENPFKLTKHHRRLKSDNGSNCPSNLSRVPLHKHQAWHALYDDLPATDIIEKFREDYEVFGTDVEKTPLLKKLHEGWANGTDQRIKRRKAWYVLFADMTMQEVVDEINTVWFDPRYQIRIETMRVRRPRLVEVASGTDEE